MERVTVSDEQFVALTAQYPEPSFELQKVTSARPGDIVLRNPTEDEYRVFQRAAWGDAEAQMTQWRTLLLLCAVSPGRPVLEGWLKRFPGLADNPSVRKALRELVGSAEVEQGKS